MPLSKVTSNSLSSGITTTFGAGAVGTPSITTTGDTNTGIYFPAADTIAFSEGGAEAARFNSSGNLQIYNLGLGGTTPSTSGTGITFPATQSASTNLNTLDDYEEGTWTPTVTGTGGSAGSQAYATQAGLYIKIGRLVQLTGYIGLTNKGSWTGQPIIGGFPFATENNTGAYSGTSFFCLGMSYPAGGSGGGAYPAPNSAFAYTFYNSGTAGVANTDWSHLTNSSQLGPFTIMYYAIS